MSDSCFECLHMHGSLCMSAKGCQFKPKTYTPETSNGYVTDSPKDVDNTIELLLQKAQAKKAVKEEEKKYMDKLVNDHWAYIEGVLYKAIQYDEATEMDEARIAEIEFHYKSSAKHFWGHAREYHVGETL